jgi:O-antigen ligase
MTPKLASLICVAYIAWLFYKDSKRNKEVSSALWIPLAWAVIFSSRPMSTWLGMGGSFETTEDYVEGSPIDRLFSMFLIGAGAVVLSRRKLNWNSFYRDNKWLIIFYIYLLISCVWSDFPFVSLKRWVKDFGNVIMVLVVVTEKDPIQATKALLARCSYVLIPWSVLLVKYYPDLGVYYNRWTYQRYVGGVTVDKNLLGTILFVCGLSQFWIFIELRKARAFARDKAGMIAWLLLMAMTLWLLIKAQSSTALGCTFLGCLALIALRLPAIRSRAARLGTYGVGLVLALFFLHLTLNIGDLFVGLLGRDLTFTGRTEIWQAVLTEPINPLTGTGFYSFWLGDRVDRLSEKYFYHLNEAHNGYIECYLNTGLISLFLLGAVMVTSAKKIMKGLKTGSVYEAFRLAFLVIVAVYNITEATFNKPGPMWFLMLLVLMTHPRRRQAKLKEQPGVSSESAGAKRSASEPIGAPGNSLA